MFYNVIILMIIMIDQYCIIIIIDIIVESLHKSQQRTFLKIDDATFQMIACPHCNLSLFFSPVQ